MSLPDPVEPLSKERLRLWLKLLKASSAIESEVRRRLRDEFRSTLPRFDVMSALYRHPQGLKMSEISDLLRVSNGNVTGIVERLVEDRLALRLAVPGDKRAMKVRLTPAGQTAFATLAEAHEGWIDGLLGGMDQHEIDTLGALLDRVAPETREGGAGHAHQR
ncbi:MAG: MarR family transcriptional regulator [Pseudomonadota bacterium]